MSELLDIPSVVELQQKIVALNEEKVEMLQRLAKAQEQVIGLRSALRWIVDHYGWGGGGHRAAYLTASRALDRHV